MFISHHSWFCACCIAALGLTCSGAFENAWFLIVPLTAMICFVGVPHGGLDHWTGRRLLSGRYPRTWMVIFFMGYLFVSAAVVVGWFLFPAITIILFLLLSAFHFGCEEPSPGFEGPMIRTIFSLASGGLVIWIPALFRTNEFCGLLRVIVPSGTQADLGSLCDFLRATSLIFTLIAFFDLILTCFQRGQRSRGIRNGILAVTLIFAPILLSFGLYFCGWHSVRGLARLRRENGLTSMQLMRATLPLSIAALTLTGTGMWYFSRGLQLTDPLTRTLFIGLSAIAVPHLILHSVEGWWRLAQDIWNADRPDAITSSHRMGSSS